MRWLKELENYNISFHAYILQKQDSIFIHDSQKKNQIIYVADGLIQVLKIFTNNERICSRLIHKDQIIKSSSIKKKQKRNHYYLIEAVKKTTIITIPLTECSIKKSNRKKIFFTNIHEEYSEIIGILSHKNTKMRIIQLVLITAKRCGHISNNRIIVPIYLPHQTIAAIIGSQRVTVSRCMSSLKQEGLIEYSSKSIIIRSITKLIKLQK